MFHKFGFYLICCKYILCHFNNNQSQMQGQCIKALEQFNMLKRTFDVEKQAF